MRQLLYTIFCVSVIIWSCSESGDDQPFDSLVGKWKLDKYCESPGDSSCPWQTPSAEEIYEFRNDMTYDFKGHRGQTCSGMYRIDTTSQPGFDQLFFHSHTGTSPCNDHSKWLVKKSATEVIISPICIEECTYIYKKI